MKRLFNLLAIAVFVCTAANLKAQNFNRSSVTINGVEWATRNVGAPGTFVANPEDYGNLYNWARAQMACPEGWRLPAQKEMEMFRFHAGVPTIWTTRNGVAGRQFGQDDNTVFFPAAGMHHISDKFQYVGTDGIYWSGTIAPGRTSFILWTDREIIDPMNIGFHDHAYSVRCVRDMSEPLPSPETMTVDPGVKIGGKVWATRNVGRQSGTFAAKPESAGGYFTFEEAQSACPDGWRTPSPKELKKMVEYRSKFVKVNGVTGRWFGQEGNRIFLPAAGIGGMHLDPDDSPKGDYWSNAKGKVYDGEQYAYSLFFFSNPVVGIADPTDNTTSANSRNSVRCVKK